MNSSIAVPMRPSKSSRRNASWSGFSASAFSAKDVVCLVVSVPATAISTKKAPISNSLSRSPSTSAFIRLVNRSSAGTSAALRASISCSAMSCRIAAASTCTSSGRRSPSRSRSATR